MVLLSKLEGKLEADVVSAFFLCNYNKKLNIIKYSYTYIKEIFLHVLLNLQMITLLK